MSKFLGFLPYLAGDIQLVVVGNNNVGKSSLCVTFSTGQFPSLFTPMECNRVPHEKDVTVGETTVHVKCVDTEGHVSKSIEIVSLYNNQRNFSWQFLVPFLFCFYCYICFMNESINFFIRLSKITQVVWL